MNVPQNKNLRNFSDCHYVRKLANKDCFTPVANALGNYIQFVFFVSAAFGKW